MSWQEKKTAQIRASILGYYQEKITVDPAGTLVMIEEELASQWVRLGNDWLGRGVAMDTVITATIEALEIVRQDCRQKTAGADGLKAMGRR